VADIIKRIKRDQQIATYEARRIRKDGSIIHVSVTYSPIKDSEGKIVGISKISHDITDRKKAEAALRESEERFKQLANAITQLAWIANSDGYIVWYNDRWYNYSGTTPEQMEGWGWQSVHDPEALPEVIKKWTASIETGEPFEMVFPLRGKDGIYRDFLTRGIPIKDAEGKVHQWFGTNTDVSALRKAELDLKQAQERLNLVLDNGHVGVWERDLKTNRLIFDKQMERMFGFEEGTFECTYEAFEKCLVAEDLPHVREAVRKALNENVPIDTIYKVKLPDGKINHINSKGFIIEEKEGQPVKLAGVCFDITAMKEGAEEALFNLNEELLRSNKELEQFAFVASHDLQEPLRTISTFTNLLAQRYKGKLDEDARQFLHYTVDGASRMQVLINDLLSYSRISTRGQEFSEVDLNKVLTVTLDNLKTRIEEKNALISSDKLPVIYGDEGQLGQLIQNLVGNALKFCTTMPRIHVSAREETDHYLFSVKDNGIGIEAEYSDKIFLIFQRLVNKEEFEGSGIGLAICKRVVERHGGKIFFESKPGEGTTFYFTIPKKPNI
jgi:PAS domain S-box-containing protein